MLHDNPSISTISSRSQATLSSWSVYHHAKLTSGQTISDSTWSDQGNDGKNKQWYYNILRWTMDAKVVQWYQRMVSCQAQMGRSSSLKSQGMDMDMVLLWSEDETSHSLELTNRSPNPRSIGSISSMISQAQVIIMYKWKECLISKA